MIDAMANGPRLSVLNSMLGSGFSPRVIASAARMRPAVSRKLDEDQPTAQLMNPSVSPRKKLSVTPTSTWRPMKKTI